MKETVKMQPTIFVGEKDYDKVGFKLQNTLIVGKIGSGKSTVTDNIVASLLETCNPDEYTIDIIDIKCTGIWYQCVNEKRYNVPLINSVVKEESGEDLARKLSYYRDLVNAYKCNNKRSPKTLIIVVDEFHLINHAKDINTVVNSVDIITSLGPSVGIYLIAGFGDCLLGVATKRININNFTLRIGTTHDNHIREGIFSEYTQTLERKKAEGRYLRDIRAEEINGGKCVYGIIPRFKPYTFLRKLCKAYSIGKKE